MALIIISYDPKDARFKDEVKTQLKVLSTLGHTIWSAEEVPAGEIKKDVRKEKWNKADVIIPLISADYLANDEEMISVQSPATTNRGVLVPVLVRSCLYNVYFNVELPSICNAVKALNCLKESDKEEFWADFVNLIRQRL
jgi:hypothetical protein